jgi:hypothetical protein
LLLHLLVWPAFACLTSQLYFGEHPELTAVAFRGNSHWRGWLWMAIASWGIILILPELVTSGLFIAFYYTLSEVIKVNESMQEWLMPDVIYILSALGFLVFLWLSSTLFIAIPAKSLEGLKVGKSFRRSWSLSRGSRLKTLFVRFALVFTTWLLNLSFSALLLLLLRLTIRNFGVWVHYYRNLYYGIGFFAAFSASMLVGPIFPIALTLIYYDQRIRHEGYDIERMMEAAGLNPAVPLSSGDEPAAAEAEEFPA